MVSAWRWKYVYFTWLNAAAFCSKVLRRKDFIIGANLKDSSNRMNSGWFSPHSLWDQKWYRAMRESFKIVLMWTAAYQFLWFPPLFNLWTEKNAGLWTPRSKKEQANSEIRKFFEKNQPDMYMWTGIERFDAERFLINGQPTNAPKFFNHTWFQ